MPMKSVPSSRRIPVLFRIACALLLVAGAAGRAAAEGELPSSWTSREAVIFGLRNSPDSSIALQRIEAARAAQTQAEAVLKHPHIDLSAAYAQTDNPMFSFGNILNQGTFSNDIDFNDPGRTDNLNLKAELTYRLYNGGRDEAGVAAAASTYLASEAGLKEVEHQLGYEIVRAFQNIVQAADQLQARQAELEAIDSSLQVAQARFDAGDLLKTEVLNFEVQKARTSENLIISQHRQELAEKVFLNLLGLENGSTTLNTRVTIPQIIPKTPAERPELTRLNAMLEAARANLDRAEGVNRPTLDGFASYQVDYGFENDGSGESWMAGVKLNYNLWDGRLGHSDVALRQAELNEMEEQLHKLRLGINLDIQEARLNYQQALERRGVTDKMVEVARESAQLSRERFKEGVILSSDLLDTEVRLTDTLVRQSAARANYRIAAANLRRALGYQQFQETTELLMENQ